MSMLTRRSRHQGESLSHCASTFLTRLRKAVMGRWTLLPAIYLSNQIEMFWPSTL
ncbi:rCG44358 [Rattus norvegicus]|uniref:RCG44358 n=1 Tax=Rattus norvegicus TaxID=10116 RepID=A6I5B9_RAT|nr:rCG44358 [Rattus norvegicus]